MHSYSWCFCFPPVWRDCRCKPDCVRHFHLQIKAINDNENNCLLKVNRTTKKRHQPYYTDEYPKFFSSEKRLRETHNFRGTALRNKISSTIVEDGGVRSIIIIIIIIIMVSVFFRRVCHLLQGRTISK